MNEAVEVYALSGNGPLLQWIDDFLTDRISVSALNCIA